MEAEKNSASNLKSRQRRDDPQAERSSDRAPRALRVVIAGGGNIGARLASVLENDYRVKVIEPFQMLGEIDDAPVLEVDPNARLMLENSELKPLLQSFKGVTELSPVAKGKFEDFLATQNVSFEGPELRRLHDKLLKWIEGIPLNQILVIKLSGLSGKANVYASYQSKADADAQGKGDD